MRQLTKGLWVVVGALTLVKGILSGNPPLVKNAPTYFINGPAKNFRDAVRSEGFIIPKEDAHWENPVTSECECRSLCWTYTQCLGSSTHQESGKVICRVTAKPPHNLTLVDNAGGTFSFWRSSIDYALYRVFEDFLYLVPKATMNYDDSRAYCERIPGHRLGMFKDISLLRVLSRIHMTTGMELWIDLHNSPDGPAWGDGVLLDKDLALTVFRTLVYINSDTNPIRVKMQNELDDNPAKNIRGFVCQANLGGLHW
ncbi:uncharacterized protein [Macrobrachium rosenbergii]|uniref:uncharacterized protein n=1 Tax=Macrobrachium rosenbergii TaxID=79674 RepID=UPI0034D67080